MQVLFWFRFAKQVLDKARNPRLGSDLQVRGRTSLARWALNENCWPRFGISLQVSRGIRIVGIAPDKDCMIGRGRDLQDYFGSRIMLSMKSLEAHEMESQTAACNCRVPHGFQFYPTSGPPRIFECRLTYLSKSKTANRF